MKYDIKKEPQITDAVYPVVECAAENFKTEYEKTFWDGRAKGKAMNCISDENIYI